MKTNKAGIKIIYISYPGSLENLSIRELTKLGKKSSSMHNA
jgi:hypothetical protein